MLATLEGASCSPPRARARSCCEEALDSTRENDQVADMAYPALHDAVLGGESGGTGRLVRCAVLTFCSTVNLRALRNRSSA